MDEGEIKNDNDMFMEDECVVCIRNLGGKLVLILIMAGILVCVVAVVLVGMELFRECSFSVIEVEYLVVGFGLVGGDIFNLGRNLVAVVVALRWRIYSWW